MKQIIGIIGASGDLGLQLTERYKTHRVAVLEYSRSSGNVSLDEILEKSSIIHICAPVEAVRTLGKTTALLVLHDSVMNTSKRASDRYLDGKAAIVHMLMNNNDAVVVASDAPHHDEMTQHLKTIGLTPHSMTVREHDYMIARSQAPLALLCKTLLPYLYEQADKGLLTPSGQLLVDTLRSRELVWTDATVHSILQNPELDTLLLDMQTTLIRERNK